MFILLEKSCGESGKENIKEHICVNAATPKLFSEIFHFGFWASVGGSLTEIYNSCCCLKRLDHWLYVKRGLVQLQEVIFARLCYSHVLTVKCNAIPEFTDLILFPIWCLLSNSPDEELLIITLWQEFHFWPTNLPFSSEKNGLLK